VKRLLVTGAAGFIGSNFVRRVLQRQSDWHVLALDALTYAGNPANIEHLEDTGRFEFVRGDICDEQKVSSLFEGGLWGVINLAAETHVDRSIHGGAAFVRTNVVGVQVLLELSRLHGVDRFVQVSTDEVYGSLDAQGRFSETSPLAPNSPYSASKASADLLVRAYHHTHGVPGVITRCSNNYGPYQFPEKVIPLFVTNLLEGRKVPLYGDGSNVRDWIHVQDHCDALIRVLQDGQAGEIYNIGADNELSNLELTRAILRQLGQDDSMIQRVTDRPGHDWRYAIDARKLRRELGWSPQVPFEQGLAQTVQWYVDNKLWWQAVRSGDYRKYYQRQYGTREDVGS